MLVDDLLAPCFIETPTAGAVILLSTNEGVQFLNINLNELDASQLLLDASMYMCNKLGVHTPPETLQ